MYVNISTVILIVNVKLHSHSTWFFAHYNFIFLAYVMRVYDTERSIELIQLKAKYKGGGVYWCVCVCACVCEKGMGGVFQCKVRLCVCVWV